MELTQADTLGEPEINFTPMVLPDTSPLSTSSGTEATYTLVMTDPDMPSGDEPAYREFRHWCVIPGSENMTRYMDG